MEQFRPFLTAPELVVNGYGLFLNACETVLLNSVLLVII